MRFLAGFTLGGLVTALAAWSDLGTVPESHADRTPAPPDRVALCRMANEVAEAKREALAARTLAAESFAIAVRGLPNGTLELERIPAPAVPFPTTTSQEKP